MQLYSIHFIFASAAFSVLSLIFLKSSRRRLEAFFFIPITHYILFYNYNYGIIGGVFTIIQSYVGAIYSGLLFFLLTSLKKISVQFVLVRYCFFKIFFVFVLQFVCVLYAVAVPWAFDTFPLSNTEAVLFTLFAGTNNGAEEFIISSVGDEVIYPSVVIFIVLLLIQSMITFALSFQKVGLAFSICGKLFSVTANNFNVCFYFLQKKVFLAQLFYCVALSFVLPGIVLSAPFQALFQIPVDSELYRNHYIHPDSYKIKNPEKLKNAIVIMMESMETNFESHTPEIAELQKDNANFPPGGISVAGTSWTIAAITGKLCGIPLNMPMGINEYLGNLPTYLPNAKCLMDILEEKGYKQLYMQGSSGDFTQKRSFWTTHGNVMVHDIEYYKRTGKIPEDYHVFWGFEDRKLYELAKEELNHLADSGVPFVLYMLTVDTHQPEGFVDSRCSREYDYVDGKFPKALRCASKQLSDFLAWVQDQSWSANTVISVMGDHTMPELSEKAGISASDSLYWTNFIINSAINKSVGKRAYSSLDMFPTLLEAMGFEIDNRGLGLGRSLYSDKPTMLEVYGLKKLNALLRERSFQYDKFLFK